MIASLARRPIADIDRLGCVAVVAIVAAAWFVEIGPTRERVLAAESHRVRIDVLREESVALDGLRRELQAAVGRVDRVRDGLDDALPCRREELATLQRIAETAAAVGFDLERLEPSPPVGDGVIESVTVRLAGVGDFAAAVRLLDELAADPRASRVASVAIEGEEPRLRAEITLHLLRRKADDEVENGAEIGTANATETAAGRSGRDA